MQKNNQRKGDNNVLVLHASFGKLLHGDEVSDIEYFEGNGKVLQDEKEVAFSEVSVSKLLLKFDYFDYSHFIILS